MYYFSFINHLLLIFIIIPFLLNIQCEETHKEDQLQHADDVIKAELVALLANYDSDEDGELDIDELTRWVRRSHAQQLQRGVDTQWAQYEPTKREEHTWQDYDVTQREYLDWDEYEKRTSKDLDEEHKHNKVPDGEERKKHLLIRHKHRWLLADEDGDGQLVKSEFKYFLHPEESKNCTIRAVLVEELKQDLDADKDGLISYKEYIDHVKNLAQENEKNDPQYIQDHKVHFETYLDVTKDGALNDEELSKWISPDFDKHQMEADRLMDIGDEDQDRKITAEELMNQYEQFYNLLSPEFWDRFIPEDEENIYSHHNHDEL